MGKTGTKIQGQRERKLGAFFGIFQVLSNLASKLLLVPIILHYLNQAEFGLYQLIGAFVGYLALIDFGISGALGRFIANCQAKNDQIRQDNVFAMCMIIYSFLAGFIVIIGLYLYHHLDIVFSKSLSPKELSDARIMFIILIFSICTTVLGRTFIGVNGGHERFIFPRITDSICALAKVAVVAAVLGMGHRAIGIVAAEASINIVFLSLNAAYAVIVLRVRFKLHYWDWFLFREVTSFAFWTFLAAVVLQVNFRLGTVLLGIMTTAGIAGIYAIALQINTIYNILPSVISSVFLPEVTRLVVKEANGETLTQTIIGPSRYQFILTGAVLSCFILFGRQFIFLWAGSDYLHAWGVALLILVPVTIPICQNTILSILYAKMLNRGRAIITLFFAIISAFCAIYLTPIYGLYGPAIATSLALTIGHGLILNLYYHYRVGLNMVLFFKKVTSKILPVILIVTTSSSALLFLPLGNGWASLAERLALFLLFYSITMWIWGMNKNEKAFFFSAFKTVIHCIKIEIVQEAKAK